MSPEPEPACSQCGQPDAQAVGDEVLCAACCHERGSCGAVPDVEPTGRPSPVRPVQRLTKPISP